MFGAADDVANFGVEAVSGADGDGATTAGGAAAGDEDDEPLRITHGWLLKKGQNSLRKQRRWFMLHGFNLLYYKEALPNPADYRPEACPPGAEPPTPPTPLGDIPLAFSRIKVAQSSGGKGEYGFSIHTPNRTVTLFAENSSDAYLWQASLKEAIADFYADQLRQQNAVAAKSAQNNHSSSSNNNSGRSTPADGSTPPRSPGRMRRRDSGVSGTPGQQLMASVSGGGASASASGDASGVGGSDAHTVHSDDERDDAAAAAGAGVAEGQVRSDHDAAKQGFLWLQELGGGKSRPTAKHATRCWTVLCGLYLAYFVVDEAAKAKEAGTPSKGKSKEPNGPTDLLPMQFCTLKPLDDKADALRSKADRKRFPHSIELFTPASRYAPPAAAATTLLFDLTNFVVVDRFILSSDDARELAEWRAALQQAMDRAMDRVQYTIFSTTPLSIYTNNTKCVFVFSSRKSSVVDATNDAAKLAAASSVALSAGAARNLVTLPPTLMLFHGC